MADANDDQSADEKLPAELREQLEDLDRSELLAVRSHVDARLASLRPTFEAVIESKANGEVLDVDVHGTTAFVRMRPPGGTDEPVLYEVTRRPDIDGEDDLDWAYIGHVREDGPAGGIER